ncbi:MAG: ADP-ribosylglycohydrolase family protein, partial [Bradymonadaceae bacterium]
QSAFGGEGSFGNGAAMRVAPVGAYFADDLDVTVEAAEASARITHAHAEGRAGAIAVAVAAAMARRTRDAPVDEAAGRIVEVVRDRTPAGQVREGIEEAERMGDDASVAEVARAVGSGQRVTAMDTVPFVIWSETRHLDRTSEALWQTVKGGGDRDTTAAMVGGIVSQRTELEDVPEEWFARREELDW